MFYIINIPICVILKQNKAYVIISTLDTTLKNSLKKYKYPCLKFDIHSKPVRFYILLELDLRKAEFVKVVTLLYLLSPNYLQ